MNLALLLYRRDLGSREGKGLGQSHNNVVEKVMVSTLTWLVYKDRGVDTFKWHHKYSLQGDRPHHWHWYWVPEKIVTSVMRLCPLCLSLPWEDMTLHLQLLSTSTGPNTLDRLVLITANLFPTPFWQGPKGWHVRLSYQHWGMQLELEDEVGKNKLG